MVYPSFGEILGGSGENEPGADDRVFTEQDLRQIPNHMDHDIWIRPSSVYGSFSSLSPA